MIQHWTITDKAGTQVLGQVETSGAHPRFHGFDWNGETMTARMSARRGDPAVDRFNYATGEWEQDAAKVSDQLIASLKAAAEQARMGYLSPGGAKKAVYAMKQAEVEAWHGLATGLLTSLAAFLALPSATRQRRFRFAMAEASMRGEPNPAAAIARFIAGADTANIAVARIEAAEQTGTDQIKAATTIAAKRAAYTAALARL